MLQLLIASPVAPAIHPANPTTPHNIPHFLSTILRFRATLEPWPFFAGRRTMVPLLDLVNVGLKALIVGVLL